MSMMSAILGHIGVIGFHTAGTELMKCVSRLNLVLPETTLKQPGQAPIMIIIVQYVLIYEPQGLCSYERTLRYTQCHAHCCFSPSGGCSFDSFGCYISNTCVPMSSKCDGVTDCRDGEDEMDCGCEDEKFGCYVEDDIPDSLGGGRVLTYRCLQPQLMCDQTNDCYNSTIDEPDSCELILDSFWSCDVYLLLLRK